MRWKIEEKVNARRVSGLAPARSLRMLDARDDASVVADGGTPRDKPTRWLVTAHDDTASREEYRTMSCEY